MVPHVITMYTLERSTHQVILPKVDIVKVCTMHHTVLKIDTTSGRNAPYDIYTRSKMGNTHGLGPGCQATLVGSV